MSQTVETFAAGDLRLEVDHATTPKWIVVRWLGRANDPKPSQQLSTFLEQLIANAASSHRSVELRFEAIQSMNSSTIVVLVVFIRQLTSRQVPLRIVYDQRVRWQALNIDALKHLDVPPELLEFSSVA